MNPNLPAPVLRHFNQLTPAEAERLALLAEECGEVIQIVGKILRHGLESFHPSDPQTTNAQLLAAELAHVSIATSLLVDAGDVSEGEFLDAQDAKRRRIGKFLHHQPA